MKYQVQCMSIQSGHMILGSLSQFYMYGLTSLDQPPLSKPGYYTDLPTNSGHGCDLPAHSLLHTFAYI